MDPTEAPPNRAQRQRPAQPLQQYQQPLPLLRTYWSGLTRLTMVAGLRCFDPNPEYWPQIASNSQSYVQLTNAFTQTGPEQAIQIGSLAGGAPITIARSDPAARPGMLLVLVGMA